MRNPKLNAIEKSVNEYKHLPPDKKMFVLGFMQGVLSNHGDDEKKEKENKLQKKGS